MNVYEIQINMKTKKYFSLRLIFALALFAFAVAMQAQKDLKINSIFEKYGKQKGTTMVVLSAEMLDSFQLHKYQSITLPYNNLSSEAIQQSLKEDKKQARKIKEVISNGFISSGYYQLSDENRQVNRYILFKIGSDGNATLIYMEGGMESEELVNKLFIKKRKKE